MAILTLVCIPPFFSPCSFSRSLFVFVYALLLMFLRIPTFVFVLVFSLSLEFRVHFHLRSSSFSCSFSPCSSQRMLVVVALFLSFPLICSTRPCIEYSTGNTNVFYNEWCVSIESMAGGTQPSTITAISHLILALLSILVFFFTVLFMLVLFFVLIFILVFIFELILFFVFVHLPVANPQHFRQHERLLQRAMCVHRVHARRRRALHHHGQPL